MRIENNPIFHLLVERTRGPRPAEPAAPASADEVEISDRAEALRRAREAYAHMPEIREDRVAELKERIEDGSYQVSERELARRILNAHPE